MGLITNLEYITTKYLNWKNVVADEFFRIKGTKDVWVAGNSISLAETRFVIAQNR